MSEVKELRKVNGDNLELVGFAIQPNPDQMYIICTHPINVLEFLSELVPGFKMEQFPLHYGGKFFRDGNWLGTPAIAVTFLSISVFSLETLMDLVSPLQLAWEAKTRIINWFMKASQPFFISDRKVNARTLWCK